jgi:hypothetical protein
VKKTAIEILLEAHGENFRAFTDKSKKTWEELSKLCPHRQKTLEDYCFCEHKEFSSAYYPVKCSFNECPFITGD